MAVMARDRAIGRLIVPEGNAREAAVVEGVRTYPARSLPHVVELLKGKETLIPLAVDLKELLTQSCSYSIDFRDVRRQYQAKRALEVATAGGHNILML